MNQGLRLYIEKEPKKGCWPKVNAQRETYE